MRIVEIAPLCLPVPPKGVHTLRGPWDDESRAYYGLLDDQIHFVAISETQRRANQDVRYAATSLSCPTEKRFGDPLARSAAKELGKRGEQ